MLHYKIITNKVIKLVENSLLPQTTPEHSYLFNYRTRFIG